MIRKVALFDFDNTIAQGDSIARLLKFDFMHHPSHVIFMFWVIIKYIMYLLHLISFEEAKSTLLFPLKYMDQEQLKYFYENYVKIYYYDNVVEELKKKKSEGYIVIVCTASCESYMKYIDLPIDQLLGTIVDSNTGKIIGKNCKDEEKIPRILNYLKTRNIEIDYENSYAYSDSNHDIPMLSLVKNKKRVLLKTGEIVNFVE